MEAYFTNNGYGTVFESYLKAKSEFNSVLHPLQRKQPSTAASIQASKQQSHETPAVSGENQTLFETSLEKLPKFDGNQAYCL